MMAVLKASASASFPAAPVSARDARRFLRAFLAEQGADGLADAAELALSEVVTNAVLHAHTDFDVFLALEVGLRLRVEVRDRNPQLPVQRHYAEQATTGRGMELVAAYARDCGVDPDGHDGKTVWFVVDAESVSETQSEQDLLDAWGIDLDDAAASGTGADGDAAATVVLLSLPPTLWLAARQHHDAVLREFALYAAEHPDSAPHLARIALADMARALVSTQVVAALDRLAVSATAAHRLLPEGHPSPLPDAPASIDLDVPVPDGAAEAFFALQDVLDAAEALAARGLLLTRPALPEIVAVRDWACEQAISQAVGMAASPWPGTGQERFAAQLGDRDHPVSPDWDTRIVANSDRGAVAADDANRIISVSQPLADALGWDVEDLVGRRVVVLIPPELREAHVAGFTRHLTTGEAHALGVPLRLPVLRADGTHVRCGFLIEQTFAASGRTVYIAWIDPDE